jgi:hypothetical protein
VTGLLVQDVKEVMGSKNEKTETYNCLLTTPATSEPYRGPCISPLTVICDPSDKSPPVPWRAFGVRFWFLISKAEAVALLVVDTRHVHDVTTLFRRLSRAYFFVCIFLYIRAQRGRQRSSQFFALTLAVLGTLSIYMHGSLPSPLLC